MADDDSPQPTLLTGDELAEQLRINSEQVARLARSRRIPYINVGTGVREDRRYDLTAVKAALERTPRAAS